MDEHWRIARIETSDGEKYLLQILRHDAEKPYWITQRIYRYESTARRALDFVLEFGYAPSKGFQRRLPPKGL